jgi:hypothetical protein
MCRAGQNRIYAPHTTVYLVIPAKNTLNVLDIYGSGQPRNVCFVCISTGLFMDAGAVLACMLLAV